MVSRCINCTQNKNLKWIGWFSVAIRERCQRSDESIRDEYRYRMFTVNHKFQDSETVCGPIHFKFLFYVQLLCLETILKNYEDRFTELGKNLCTKSFHDFNRKKHPMRTKFSEVWSKITQPASNSYFVCRLYILRSYSKIIKIASRSLEKSCAQNRHIKWHFSQILSRFRV